MTTIVTYQLAYRTDISVDLCDRHAADPEYPLGPVQHGRRPGMCEDCQAGRDTTTTYCTSCGVTYGSGHDEEDCVCGAPYRMTVTVDSEWEAQALSIGSEYLPAAARKVRDRDPLTATERQAYVGWIADQWSQAE